MAQRRGRPRKDDAVVVADRSAKIDVEKDLSEENKADWIKRVNKENLEAKKANKITDEWYVQKGNKLVRKVKKASGGVYSTYICNVEKNPLMLTEVKEKGLLRL